MFNWFRRILQLMLCRLTYPKHYNQTVRQALGEKRELTLIHATAEGPFVNLVYRWEGELSYDEADRLDTRARAYIACAIYDAARTDGLFCLPGPPHGQRPTWCVEGERMPISLVSAGFDVSDKTCFMQIGPGILMEPQGGGSHCRRLIEGFQSRFDKISV